MKPLGTHSLIFAASAAASYLSDLPPGFNKSQWSYVTYANPSVAVLPIGFNRSVVDAPWASTQSDEKLAETNQFINTTSFVAYDEKFFDIIGRKATVEKLHDLPFQSHEAPCFNSRTKELFFVEWGPPGGVRGEHSWQYLLNTETNKLRKITTDPPTYNAHGCVVYNSSLYVVTDGNRNETASLVQIDAVTLEKKVLLNNYYQQPFNGFNDIDIDSDGNFWLTDSWSGWGRDVIPFTPPTNPTIYMVNGTTMQLKPVWLTTGNANGIAISPRQNGDQRVYLADTGLSNPTTSQKDPYGARALFSYKSSAGGVLSDEKLLSNPISYFYDGIRVSRNGWIFTGAGDGVDVIDPITGLTLGTIRVGGGENLAVNLAFGEHELWIVGRGGVWHVKILEERLDRTW